MLGLRTKLLVGGAIAMIGVVSTPAADAFQVFTNRQQWETALPTQTTTFDFSDIAGTSVSSGTVLNNGLSVSYIEPTQTTGGFRGRATSTYCHHSCLSRASCCCCRSMRRKIRTHS
jgi:hypothetical protein